jgi:hypothetical protein
MITAEKLLASEQGLCSIELSLKPLLELFIILNREHLLTSGVPQKFWTEIAHNRRSADTDFRYYYFQYGRIKQLRNAT